MIGLKRTLRVVEVADHGPLVQIEPAASTASYTRSIRIGAACERKTHLDVPASEQPSQAPFNPREALGYQNPCVDASLFNDLFHYLCLTESLMGKP